MCGKLGTFKDHLINLSRPIFTIILSKKSVKNKYVSWGGLAQRATGRSSSGPQVLYRWKPLPSGPQKLLCSLKPTWSLRVTELFQLLKSALESKIVSAECAADSDDVAAIQP